MALRAVPHPIIGSFNLISPKAEGSRTPTRPTEAFCHGPGLGSNGEQATDFRRRRVSAQVRTDGTDYKEERVEQVWSIAPETMVWGIPLTSPMVSQVAWFSCRLA